MNELALFAGAGGGILGGKLLGWRTVCAVEFGEYPRRVLMARQNDGCLEPFPIWDDVRTFDGKPWRGIADVVSGGFPCQDISCAGNGAGINGERSGLWVEMARIIDEVRPRYAFVENSPMLTSRGLGIILGDLAEMGYDAKWGVCGADDVGAPHRRKRIWIVGYPSGERLPESDIYFWKHSEEQEGYSGTWNGRRVDKPGIVGVVDGVADWMDRLKAAGNGQVPVVAEAAWKTLTERNMKNENKAREIAYNWFLRKQLSGNPVAKDVFLYDRELWDSMQGELVEAGENPNHDEVKELVRRMDKGAWLGGIAEERTFEDQLKFLETRKRNYAECGHAGGQDGIAADVSRYSDRINPPKLAEYYAEPHWSKRTLQYRESQGWVCELCLKQHRPGSSSLVTHHKSYKLADGSPAFFRETDRELMAVCADSCHQLADIARYLRVGRITDGEIADALSPLFAALR